MGRKQANSSKDNIITLLTYCNIVYMQITSCLTGLPRLTPELTPVQKLPTTVPTTVVSIKPLHLSDCFATLMRSANLTSRTSLQNGRQCTTWSHLLPGPFVSGLLHPHTNFLRLLSTAGKEGAFKAATFTLILKYFGPQLTSPLPRGPWLHARRLVPRLAELKVNLR